MSSLPDAGGGPGEPLAIRPPLQQRSRDAWNRVLAAGVGILEEGGYEAFTIGAVCRRAQVPPRAIYARATSKDALFLAVYDHAMARVRAEHTVFDDDRPWRGLSGEQVMAKAVGEVAGIFFRNSALLRSVVLISGVHPEVYRRGSREVHALGDKFTARVLSAGGTDQPEPAVRAAFNAVFSTLVVRTAYGPGFATPETSDEEFVRSLTGMVCGYLQRG